jgi:hypothetical protein
MARLDGPEPRGQLPPETQSLRLADRWLADHRAQLALVVMEVRLALPVVAYEGDHKAAALMVDAGVHSGL